MVSVGGGASDDVRSDEIIPAELLLHHLPLAHASNN